MRGQDGAEKTGADRGGLAAARKPAAAAGMPATELLALQGSLGNAAVVQMLRAAGHAPDRHSHGPGCGHEDAVQRSAVTDVLRSGGRPLDSGVRAEMESRLGADFSDVRVHTDAAAKASAAEVGARAYTSGHHVVIGDGGADKHTLAHELTHVIQQRQGPVAGTDNGGGLRVSDPSDRFERAAEANATRVMRGPAPERGEDAGHRTDTRTAARTGETVQRYTDVEVEGRALRVSENGLFLTYPDTPYIWVREDAPAQSVAPALRRTEDDPVQWNGATYSKAWLGGDVQQDCLHAAEEIINNRVRELGWGEGEYSTIETTSSRYGPTEVFGQKDATNRRQARQFAGPKNDMADPRAGEAFVIVVTTPDPDKEMSQFHAGAVVARDGNDCVVLQAWSDGNSPPNLAAADSEIYTVGDLQRSFHAAYGGPGAYFGSVGTTTVVIKAHPDVVNAS
ncbi:DUF4157 domain-containing protein [Streptomyces sp. NPDC127037]|uniref:eCIS core domain-containing protein n=1 Tax=Streptomyces sp. NPDC127037 TaxID=3347113 RepID=UPI003647AE7E